MQKWCQREIKDEVGLLMVFERKEVVQYANDTHPKFSLVKICIYTPASK